MAEETQARASGETSAPAPSSGPVSLGIKSGPGSARAGPRPAGGGGRGKFFRRKKVCKFCTEKIDAIPYRDVRLLQGFVAERGKIVPRFAATAHHRAIRCGMKSALLIDEDRVVRHSLAQWLRQAGWAVLEAQRGRHGTGHGAGE